MSVCSGRLRSFGEQLRDHLGIQGGAAAGDAAQRVEELVHPPDPVLQQVADRADTVGEQLGGVGSLDVL